MRSLCLRHDKGKARLNSDTKEGGRAGDDNAKTGLLIRATDDGGWTGALATVEGGEVDI